MQDEWALARSLVLTSGLRGAMEAKAAFQPINLIRIATGTLTDTDVDRVCEIFAGALT